MIKEDYLYCINNSSCIHRRGCARWVGNLSDDDAIFESTHNVDGYMNEKECITNYQDVDCENNFGFLDRFRFSDGPLNV